LSSNPNTFLNVTQITFSEWKLTYRNEMQVITNLGLQRGYKMYQLNWICTSLLKNKKSSEMLTD